MTTSEKVAYLKGLAEGFGIDPAAKEGKLLATIADILEDLALDMEDVHDELAELEAGLDAVSEDLEDVEDILFGDVDEDWDDEDEDEYGDEDDDGIVFYQAQCPACGETVTFEESVLLQGSIQCPVCGESLEIDVGEEEDASDED